MAALDFPSSPAVGQLYAPGGGQPTYSWNGTVWVRVPAILASPTAGYRNIVINPRMDFWQRATSLAAAAAARYCADRWMTIGSGSTVAVSYNNMALGQTPWPLSEAFYFHGTTVASVAGAGNYAMLLQRIENVRQLAGKRCVLSFFAAADAARPIGVEVDQYFGSGGSPSASTNTQLGKFTLGTTLQRYVVAFDMPSISGKVIGSNLDDYIQLKFWLDAGSTYNTNSSNLGQQSGTFYHTCIQLEEGPVATPFEMRPWHAEYELCMRYYEASPMTAIGFAPAAAGGYADYFIEVFKVTKRAPPTMAQSYGTLNNISAVNPLTATTDWCGAQLVGSALGNAGGGFQWTASAEL